MYFEHLSLVASAVGPTREAVTTHSTSNSFHVGSLVLSAGGDSEGENENVPDRLCDFCQRLTWCFWLLQRASIGWRLVAPV